MISTFLMSVLLVIGMFYGIQLGVKYAKAEEDDDIFEVTLTPDSPNGLAADEGYSVIKNYFKKANIAISKKGVNDALLEGVEFGIYSDATCETLVQKLVTDVSGSAVSEYLVLGTYYVKEISNPDKTYIVSDKVYTFELTESGKVYTETIYNVKAGAYISLEKIDSCGNSVEGVKFEIRNAAGELIETITTDAARSIVNRITGPKIAKKV